MFLAGRSDGTCGEESTDALRPEFVLQIKIYHESS